MNELYTSGFPRNISHLEIQQLAEMALKNPLSEPWITINRFLTAEQKVQVNQRIESIKYELFQKKRSSIPEAQGMDEKTWNEIKRQQEVHKFYGNMGQPETPEEFKNRYGVWPPGFKD
jgi:hypothetical protein